MIKNKKNIEGLEYQVGILTNPPKIDSHLKGLVCNNINSVILKGWLILLFSGETTLVPLLGKQS